jgi:hypothetical protein
VPYVGLNFGVYETLKAMMLKHYGLRDERELSVGGFVERGSGLGWSWQGRGERVGGQRRANTRILAPPAPAPIPSPAPAPSPSPSPPAGLPAPPKVAARLGCGALAGTTGQTVAYPFDVARRRLQVSGWQGARELHSDHGSVVAYRGMVDCFVRTVREEGFGALFKVRRR